MKAASESYMPVWPGPVVMVPMVTDVLLVGMVDYNSVGKWSSTQNNYYNLWMRQLPDQPVPFGTKRCPDVGAHLMWTLPFSMRQGNQADENNPDGDVAFPFVPNRWLVTRFAYTLDAGNNPTDVPPVVTATIIESDTMTEINDDDHPDDNTMSQYPFPEDPDFPVRRIGGKVELGSWDGKTKAGQPLVKAVGPGDVSWSVAYDNLKSVFTLYDDVGPNKYQLTYSIIGWYDNPADDILNGLPTTTNEDWRGAIESQYTWSVGDTMADVQDAVDAWLAWQESHGLKGTFDPSEINLPPQAKAAIVAWHNWQQQHGVTGDKPPLPTQSVCHSMVSVLWNGNQGPYGTGVPKGQSGDYMLPAIAIGNTAVEAIATYMATTVVGKQHQSPEDIPVIERALEAFQKDLLAELEPDPVKVETAIHNDRFELTFGGQEWIVVRPESTNDDILGTGGQQSIPLSVTNTATLTYLNNLQNEVNVLVGQILSQRQELFMLSMKKAAYRRQSAAVKEKVDQSIAVMTAQLTANTAAYNTKTAAVKSAADSFRITLGDGFILKAMDMLPSATPTDPVIMVGGTKLDAKLTAPGEYGGTSLLFVRFTGQTVVGIEVTYTGVKLVIGATELLGSVNMPAWNAIPKEAMDLWVEALILDPACAALIAKLYFAKRGITPVDNELEQLTKQIKAQQTAIWNDGDLLGFHQQALKVAAGIIGVIPSPAAVSFQVKQPWTPIYMDWKVVWYPAAADPQNALKDWSLEDIDYEWKGSSIPADGLTFQGRTVLNARTAQVIQGKFAMFENEDIYDALPPYVIDDLEAVAAMVGQIDILTQSMSGFTKQLATELISMNNAPKDPAIVSLLGNSDANFKPVLTAAGGVGAPPFFPIRSGHFSITDLWIVDAFGQIMVGKDPRLPDATPIPGVLWSESLTTDSPNYSGNKVVYGQLSPRIVQPSLVKLQLLKNDDDSIATNSSDLTSPICGWVMPNHLDNSLMIFDPAGINMGAVIKVQKEITDADDDQEHRYTIRWDAVPGSNTALGAPPDLPNAHLQAFVNNLLKTGFDGAGAYDDLVSVIDVTLWPMSNFKNQGGNQSILLGRPLALVRADIGMTLAGTPVYNEGWEETGKYYNNGGVYTPVNPPFMSVPFTVRVGDALMKGNGVIGYFEADDYNTFYAVYGANGQTRDALQMFARNAREKADLRLLANKVGTKRDYKTSYVKEGHLVSLPANYTKTNLTLLVDPSGGIPYIPGSLPANTLALPTGPVSEALNNLKATFRAGPLLLDPLKVKMPTPAEVQGTWGWMARRDVTNWNPEVGIEPYTPVATFDQEDLQLIEGWITLSGANSNDNN